MNKLTAWLDSQRIQYFLLDNEVVEIPGLGKMFLADLSGVKSIFRKSGDELVFNLMESPGTLIDEEIFYVAFLFGRNWYYYDLREEFALNILKYVGIPRMARESIPFVNLGVHTPFELLNGAGDISVWINKAKWLGHEAIGICDRNTMAGTLTLQKECEKAGIKHVFGYSLTIDHDDMKVDTKVYSLTQQGFQNMLCIQKFIMVDSENQRITIPELVKYAAGNVLVFGTLSSFWMQHYPQLVQQLIGAFDKVFYQINLTEYKAERHDFESLEATKLFFDYFHDGNDFSIEPILINDAYYPDKGDARSKIILNKVATGAAHRQSEDQYFKSADELYAQVKNLFDPEHWDVDALFQRMCANTVWIANYAEAAYETDRVFMPEYTMTPEELEKYGNSHAMFLSLLEDGFARLVPPGKEEMYRERLNNEIYVLESTDNVNYCLVQYDTVNWARGNGILVGAARGSAGGCLALYLLGITLIDPIKYDLLFERFLLPERAGLYPAKTTKIVGEIQSSSYVKAELENGRNIRFDKDARLIVKRDDEEMELYADELQSGDDVLFDNRDLLFAINKPEKYEK